MAKLTNPLMSQDARGSVSGVQFSRNVYGSFGSRKSTSTRSQQPGAIAYRAHVGAAHHAFDALDAEHKATWNLTPDTHVKPREHFLSLYLKRAARALSQFTAYPGHHGAPTIQDLEVFRQPGPDDRITLLWLRVGLPTGHLDITARPSSIRSYNGHPRKFRWQACPRLFFEGKLLHLSPYARYLTLHLSVVDLNTLRPYGRWVYRFDDDTLVDVVPVPP